MQQFEKRSLKDLIGFFYFIKDYKYNKKYIHFLKLINIIKIVKIINQQKTVSLTQRKL